MSLALFETCPHSGKLKNTSQLRLIFHLYGVRLAPLFGQAMHSWTLLGNETLKHLLFL